jgi:endonuclease-8
MAEGDSIRRIALRIDAAFAGETVTARAPGPRRPEGMPVSRLDGLTMTGAESRGKHLLLRFSGGVALHSHLGMRGGWHLYRAGERWRYPARSAWIALTDGRTEAVNFNGTSMRIVREAELRRDPRLARLGPDILDPEIPLTEVAASLRRDPGRELGDALLDQTLVAGIGNIFKSEAAFEAKVDPWREVASLSAEELELVVEGARRLMEGAVETGRQPARVYHRAKRPCPRCRTPIAARKQGDDARTTYWCPGCQR